MKRRTLSLLASFASFASIAACASQERKPEDPVSVTVTRSAVTAAEPPPEAKPSAPVRDVERQAPNAPALGVTEADRTLARKIRQHLARAPELADVGWNRVRIVASHGHVTISGELPTVAESCEVEQAVREVKGVTSVTNEIHRLGDEP